MKDLITTEEAAKLSGYHVEYIRRLVRNGQIEARKWGREWMVDKTSLLAYLKLERRPGPKPKRTGRTTN